MKELIVDWEDNSILNNNQSNIMYQQYGDTQLINNQQQLQDLLGHKKHVTLLTGAGLSVASGIDSY